MARIILQVPALLFLLLSPGLQDGAAGGEVVLHPLVLLPGLTCSDIEARLTDAYRPSVPRCGAMKGKGWFGLWANFSDLPEHYAPECFVEQMTLVYDPAANDYRNLPGVETRARGFGSTKRFHKIPDHPGWCFGVFRHELERAGYVDGATLFGGPYDFRYAPPVPGQRSAFFSGYFRRLARLVEAASRKNGGRKVILFGHSLGGATALEFVRRTPVPWRRRYVKHLVLAAPVPAAEGIVSSVQNIAVGTSVMYVPNVTQLALTLRPMWRSFETAITNLPSPAVFGRRPLVVTPRRNYSAHDVEDLLADLGFRAGVEPFRRRAVLKRTSYFKALMVPTTCINALGNKTPEQLVYRDDGDFGAAAPEIVYGDGDNTINLISMLAFDEKMRRQNKLYKSIKLRGADHSSLLTDDEAVKRIMQEIWEANHI